MRVGKRGKTRREYSRGCKEPQTEAHHKRCCSGSVMLSRIVTLKDGGG